MLREFLPALVTNWGLWIPGNFINFRFVAPRLQVLFANVVALGWNGYLSWSTHRAAHAEGGAGSSTEGETWDNARVQALFEEFDTDDSGHIDPREFQDLAFALDVPMDEASVALVVERLDKDGDGQISLPEFRSWLHTSDTFMGLKGDEDAPVLQAMLLKTRLRARVVQRCLPGAVRRGRARAGQRARCGVGGDSGAGADAAGAGGAASAPARGGGAAPLLGYDNARGQHAQGTLAIAARAHTIAASRGSGSVTVTAKGMKMKKSTRVVTN